VRNLVKVFGNRPAVALQMLEQGLHKDEIFRCTGQIVGVQDASFEIRSGEIFVIMGLSGSGKSTLIRLLNRLLEPTSGEVLVDGQNVASMDRRQLIDLRRRDMSMVFQSFALMPHRTVLDNAAFGLEVAGIDKAQREKRALQVLEQVGFDRLCAQASVRTVGRHAAAGRAGGAPGGRSVPDADGRGVFCGSIRSSGTKCSMCCWICSATTSAPSCSFRTIWTRRSVSATAFAIMRAAAWCKVGIARNRAQSCHRLRAGVFPRWSI